MPATYGESNATQELDVASQPYNALHRPSNTARVTRRSSSVTHQAQLCSCGFLSLPWRTKATRRSLRVVRRDACKQETNERSERRDIWPGARGKGVRELEQTERAREQQQQRERRGKRATSEQQQPERGKNRGRTFPPKSHRAPISPRAKHQTNKVNIAWNDHAVRSRELQQICLQSYRREQVRIVQPPFHNSHLATLKESDREKHRADAVLS